LITATPTDSDRCVAILAHCDDNVATLLADIPADGAVVDLVQQDLTHIGSIQCAAPIPFGHKTAVRSIPRGADIVKFGAVIGVATESICVGQHVHIQNVASARLGTPESGSSDAKH